MAEVLGRARATSIVGGHRIKLDHNSYCSKAGVTICHIQGNVASNLLKISPQRTFKEIEHLNQVSMESITGMLLHHIDFSGI